MKWQLICWFNDVKKKILYFLGFFNNATEIIQLLYTDMTEKNLIFDPYLLLYVPSFKVKDP